MQDKIDKPLSDDSTRRNFLKKSTIAGSVLAGTILAGKITFASTTCKKGNLPADQDTDGSSDGELLYNGIHLNHK